MTVNLCTVSGTLVATVAGLLVIVGLLVIAVLARARPSRSP